VYLTFVTESEPGAKRQAAGGKGYKRKSVYFTFVMESELLPIRWAFCSEMGEKRKSVYLAFVTARRRSEATKQR
jgi:hypothetical protein